MGTVFGLIIVGIVLIYFIAPGPRLYRFLTVTVFERQTWMFIALCAVIMGVLMGVSLITGR
jgi:hypothetical protein